MRRRLTIAEARFPNTADFVEISRTWPADAARTLIESIWKGLDLLTKGVLEQVDCSAADEDLERSITSLLVPLIRRNLDAAAPFDVEHGPFERETRKPPPAQPPAYDIAFVLHCNPRVMWPIEAKLLRTDKAVAPYVRDLQQEFLTCRYSPFSSEAAMLGYLLKGTAEAAFFEIGKRIACSLSLYPLAPTRNHCTSDHTREVPPGKTYPRNFRCHHLILRLTN